jgi:glycosyltransferase involved in cell wall biosynthesis
VKVGIVVRILQPAGEQRDAIMEARALTHLGHEAEVLFLRRNLDYSYAYQDLLEKTNHRVVFEGRQDPLEGVYSFLTGVYQSDRRGGGHLDYGHLRGLSREIARDGFDCLVCHDRWGGLAGYYCRKRLGIPYVVLEHERLVDFRDIKRVPLLSSYLNRIERAGFLGANQVFATTDKIRKSMERKIPELRAQIKLNPQGMDVEPGFARYESRQNRILAVAMWDSWRRPWEYLEIAKALPAYELRIVGSWRSTALRDRTISQIAALGLKNVEVLDQIPDAQMSDEFRRTKFVVRLSYGEYGVGEAVIQSIQHATPVVAGRDLGTSDLIREFGGGRVVDNPRGAADFVLQADNPASYDLLQQQLLAIGRQYSWDRHARTLLSPWIQRPAS